MPLSTPAVSTEQALFVLRSADMQSTADQAFSKQFSGTNYVLTNVIAVRKTGGVGVSCIGGVYTGSSKGGDALVAAAQSWASLTGASTSAVASLANLFSTKVESATPNLSLTTGSLSALTADIFLFGVIVD